MQHFNPRAYVRHDAQGGESGAGVTFQSTCLREARRARGTTEVGPQ